MSGYGSPGDVEELLRHLRSWPYLHIESRTAAVALARWRLDLERFARQRRAATRH